MNYEKKLIPCIDCIILPMCRSYILNNKLNPPNYDIRYILRFLPRWVVTGLYGRCSILETYTCESGYEDSFLLHRAIVYILERKDIYERYKIKK